MEFVSRNDPRLPRPLKIVEQRIKGVCWDPKSTPFRWMRTRSDQSPAIVQGVAWKASKAIRQSKGPWRPRVLLIPHVSGYARCFFLFFGLISKLLESSGLAIGRTLSGLVILSDGCMVGCLHSLLCLGVISSRKTIDMGD
jgi:hypothetical protein